MDEAFIGFLNATQLYLGLHFLKGGKYLVAEEEDRALGNLALVRGCTDAHAVNHAMHILHVAFHVQLGNPWKMLRVA